MKRILFVLALAACGSSGSSKPDLSKMAPEEACRVISKRAFECKDTIVPAVSAAMKKAGADDGIVKAMTAQMQMPMPCDHADAQALDQMITCYDEDCGKLSQCFVGVAQEALRPAGPVPAPYAPDLPRPGSASSAPPPLTP